MKPVLHEPKKKKLTKARLEALRKAFEGSEKMWWVIMPNGHRKKVSMYELTLMKGDNPRPNSVVMRHEIGSGKNIMLLSTVFLGLDHNFMGTRPVLYETMLFAPKAYAKKLTEVGLYNDFQERYHTKREATQNHKALLRILVKSFPLLKVLQKKAI